MRECYQACRQLERGCQPTGLLFQGFQHAKQEESDDKTEELGLEVIEHGPEDAGHYPMLAPTVEEGESLDPLLEYTLPDGLATITINIQLRMKQVLETRPDLAA